MTAFTMLAILVGVGLGLIAARKKFQQPGYFAACEYWVYIPGDKMPEQDQIMTNMVRENHFAKGGLSPIGPSEGLVFSDIRLHCSVVLRAKNPHVFRPDIFTEACEPTSGILEALANSQAMVKVRFISSEPLRDDRHLRFLPHMAYAVAELGDGKAIYDVVTEKLYSIEEFESLIASHQQASDPDVHLRVVWVADDGAGRAESKGLVKKGFQEVVTLDVSPDSRILVSEIVMEAAKKIWTDGEAETEVSVSAFDDEFRIELEPTKDGRRSARILRVQSA